jgi:outer membrane protein assembly factor BamA
MRPARTLGACVAWAALHLCALPEALAQEVDAMVPATEPIESAEGVTGPIVSVVIEPALENENPWIRAGVAPGTVFTAARARESLRHALASGTFAEARVTARLVAGGVELTIRGQRRYRLYSFELRGTSARRLDLVSQDAALHAGDAVTDAMISDALRRIERGYHDAGFVHAEARAIWRETDDPAARVLIAQVTEGSPLRLNALRLQGVPPEARAEIFRELGMYDNVADTRQLADRRAAVTVVLYEPDRATPQRRQSLAEVAAVALRRNGYLTAQLAEPEYVPSVSEPGVDLRLEVTPGAHFRIVWQGLRAMPEESLLGALRLPEERSFDEATLTSLTVRVQDYYARRGFYDAQVRVIVTDAGPNERLVRFTVREGSQVFTRHMNFAGATVFSQSELRANVEAVVAAELPDEPRLLRGRIDRERTYTAAAYSTAAQRLVQRYRDSGYLDATVEVAPVTRVPAAQSAAPALDVTFRVTEGTQTFLEELTFEGNRAQSSASLSGIWDMRLGVALSYRAIEEARVRLTDHFREEGYAFARVEPAIVRSADHTRARVEVSVHEGPRVRVGHIDVRGNEDTLESVVRGRLAFTEGDIYRVSALRTSQRRLGELGVFAGINIGFEDPDVEAPVKTVVVQLIEQLPQNLEIRGGFSLGQGLRAGLEYGYLNLLGRAMNFSLRAQGGLLIPIEALTPTFPVDVSTSDLLTASVTPSLSFPHIAPLGPRFSATLDGVLARSLQPPSFALTTFGGGASITFRPVPSLSFTLTGEVQRIATQLFGADSIEALLRNRYDACYAEQMVINPGNPDRWLSVCNTQQDTLSSQLRGIQAGSSLLGALRVGVAYDQRDSALTPTRGYYLSLTTELLNVFAFARTSRNEPDTLSRLTVHAEARATGYIPLPFGGWVLMVSGRVGQNFQLDDRPNARTHPSRLFFLGGANSMRGWLQNQLVPQDKVDEVRNVADAQERRVRLAQALGGELMLNFIVDLRIPTGLCGGGFCLALGAFLDVGNTWRDPTTLMSSFNLRYSPGVGLRVTSPFGIIAFDVGFNPAYEPLVREDWWQVQFSLGST